MSTPTAPPDPSSPRTGDILVSRDAKAIAPVYAVCQLPGIMQFSVSAREDAIRLARGFGQKHAVDVWYSEAGTCRLIATFRTGPSSTAAGPNDQRAPRSAARSDWSDS